MGFYKRKAIKFIYILPVAHINCIMLKIACCIYILLNIYLKTFTFCNDSADCK